ncbi:MAG: preprotein translocase subunit SecY [Armatimonadota bacterium]|nr:preprotein translocase subunit SecY [Armatimonadota bacterium]MDR7427945.1 preprotein translocase subunit SecY [Armatimonadota bacterium]MDR7464128.1 preprotein translocase subunit SecY [Armatimonadota bacterium]MDR7470419.1 preprotein translocase subunit SecY [Armatimonadota bacterium]MDR7473501.1 preprotein translocase subunit SecY [Armatimonadota bacterium]
MQVRSLSNPLRIPDLRRRLLFTAFMLVLYRLGAHLPVPGVDVRALQQLFQQQGSLLSFFDLFVGGALSNFAIFALGVFPYITASIIFSLLQVVFPRLKEMATEEGEAGRRKIGQYTRYLTVVLAILQGIGQMYLIRSQNAIPDPRPLVLGTIVTTLVAGTMLLTWMGEIMTEYGVGNGVSLIIFGGIVARLPDQVGRTLVLLRAGELGPLAFFLDVAIVLVSIVVVVGVTQATRKIPVQYAKRVVGRRVYGGQSTHLPMKLIQAGVIPIIFAISVLQFPQTIAQFGRWEWLQRLAAVVLPGGSYLGDALYFALIIIFTYFYTAVSFDPHDVANNIKKYGGFIPGIRPGRPTSDYLTRVTERLTFVGALVLGLIAVVPTLFRGPAALGGGAITFYLAGTSLIIVVGVALETMKQIEAYVLMRHYEGFMR